MKKYVAFAVAVAMFGEIYFYPFDGSLRFSAAIITLNLFMLVDEEVTTFYTCFTSGIGVFLLRSLLGVVFSAMTLQEVFLLHGPSIIYYIVYGASLSLLNIRRGQKTFMKAVVLLAFSDIISNIAETIFRQQQITSSILWMFILVGVIRSVLAYSIYLFYKNQEFLLLSREHRKKYAQLNLLVSNIQAELFYLKKSTKDIENVMKKSYALYQDYKEDDSLKQKTLNIALEIHEIKKDYYKVLHGFESFLENFEENGAMMLSDMFKIIGENTSRYLEEKRLAIELKLDYEEDFQVYKYYHLFTILNNLIINAIDACEGAGRVEVFQRSYHGYMELQVVDNGEGIEEEILPYIFNPGFTTKYDVESGEASTGIGLAHVKSMVEELKGEVHVKSDVEMGTIFTITIPKND